MDTAIPCIPCNCSKEFWYNMVWVRHGSYFQWQISRRIVSGHFSKSETARRQTPCLRLQRTCQYGGKLMHAAKEFARYTAEADWMCYRKVFGREIIKLMIWPLVEWSGRGRKSKGNKCEQSDGSSFVINQRQNVYFFMAFVIRSHVNGMRLCDGMEGRSRRSNSIKWIDRLASLYSGQTKRIGKCSCIQLLFGGIELKVHGEYDIYSSFKWCISASNNYYHINRTKSIFSFDSKSFSIDYLNRLPAFVIQSFVLSITKFAYAADFPSKDCARSVNILNLHFHSIFGISHLALVWMPTCILSLISKASSIEIARAFRCVSSWPTSGMCLRSHRVNSFKRT